MTNDKNSGGWFKYALPWMGMAAVLGLMWAVVAE